MNPKELFSSAKRVFNYNEYKDLIVSLFAEGLATGEVHNEARISATKINLQRIHRLDKTTVVINALDEKIKKITNSQTWYLITEGWCGDSAQCTPIIAKIADLSDKVTLKLILRDENLPIMEQFLTNGGKAIPKLIIVDDLKNEVIATWGPRPTAIQKMVVDYKNEFTLADHDEFTKNLHLWYAKDKGHALQHDFLELNF